MTTPRSPLLGVWLVCSLVVVAMGAGLTTRSIGAVPTHQRANGSGPPIDGIHCDPSETVTYHVHAKLDVYIHGVLYPVPPFIGFPNNYGCVYYLHTHPGYDQGIIHLEFPYKPERVTLKQFLDIWRATRPAQAAPVRTILHHGPKVRFYVDGKRFHGTASSLPLVRHELITVEIGKPHVPPLRNYAWPPGV